jgi:hypothetical protein
MSMDSDGGTDWRSGESTAEFRIALATLGQLSNQGRVHAQAGSKVAE